MVADRDNLTILVFLSLILFQIGGCTWKAKEELLTRPAITPSTGWRIEEGCGYERCGGPPVDFLIGEGLKIRIGSQSSDKPALFLIVAGFLLDKNVIVEINPSLTYVELSDGRSLKAKGYACSGRIFDANYQIRIPPIRSSSFLTADGNNDCIFFVFDPPPPRTGETFKFVMTGIIVNGRPINVPEITFRPVLTKY